jgi:D-amino peptidase
MKVYISVDMEGASCVVAREQTDPRKPQYAEGRRLLVNDVNAAVEGALAGGATAVMVNDMHAGSFNLPAEKMHPAATMIYGTPHAGPRFPYLDKTVDVMFLVGYHARSGTYRGVLEHTMSPRDWRKVTINGREVGEIGIDAGLAGAAGVPVVLVTGDDNVCKESRALLGTIETACTKEGLGRHWALCYSPARNREHIFAAAQRALSLKKKIKPLTFGSPAEVVITYKHVEAADSVLISGPLVERLDAFTVAYRFKKLEDWYGGIWEQRGRW